MGTNFSKQGDISNLRLAAQKITEFTGDYQDFAQWKKGIECALQGTGYDRILTDEKFSKANPIMNSMVFAQLSLAVIRGSANHVVEKVETTKDGYAAWQALHAWYDESDLINCFQTYNRNLDDINNREEEYSDSAKVQMFLKHRRDPRHETTLAAVTTQTGQGNIRLTQAIARIRKCELDLIQERTSKWQYEPPQRQQRKNEDPSSYDSDHQPPARIFPSPAKKRKLKGWVARGDFDYDVGKKRTLKGLVASRDSDFDDDHGDSNPPAEVFSSSDQRQHRLRQLSPHIHRSAGEKISISKKDWGTMPTGDKTFIQDWNKRIKEQKGNNDMVVSSGNRPPKPTTDSITPETEEQDPESIHLPEYTHFYLHNQLDARKHQGTKPPGIDRA
jgi:hypothetical protein